MHPASASSFLADHRWPTFESVRNDGKASEGLSAAVRSCDARRRAFRPYHSAYLALAAVSVTVTRR